MAAPTQGFPTKSHVELPEQPSNPEQIPSKSHSNSLCKTLIILVLLLAIQLFPSQAPDFITQSILTDFWEIFHLLFIGIAVSYGLFGRRTAQTLPDKIIDSRNDDSRSYLSGISHLNSIFYDGHDSTCGPDEQDTVLNYANCECFQRSGEHLLGNGKCVIQSAKNIRSFVSNDGEGACEENVKNLNQTWCSQYVKGESLVVVSNGEYFLGGSSDFKPLNLPIRSLKSMVVDNDNLDRNECPRIEGKGNDFGEVVKIRGVVQFEEASGRSPVQWRSRSGRMEYREEERINTKPPAHCRPHSVGEWEFEFERHFKSGAIRGAKFSASPELGSTKMGSGKRKRAYKVPKIAPIHTEVASFGGPEMPPLSNEASSKSNMAGDMENILKNSTDNSEEDLGKGKEVVECSEISTKFSGLAKVLSRAKSVRTIKPNRYIANQKEQWAFQIDGNLGRMSDQPETDSSVRNGKAEESENPPSNHQNQEFNRIFTNPNPKSKPEPKPTPSELYGEEKQDFDDRKVREREEDEERENGKSWDERDARTNVDDDLELNGSEVDRKAGEFIAKFREQIRLQKTSTVEGCSGW